MISFIEGKIVEKTDKSIIVKCGHMGMEILASSFSIANAKHTGEEDFFYTYLHVREDALVLLGFKTKEERGIFLNLIEVSGIGPKAAMTILSAMPLENLASAIVRGDVNALASAKGVGKKTAERIVLELKENIRKNYKSDVGVAPQSDPQSDISLSQIEQDAQIGLMSLGLTKKESAEVIKKTREHSPKTSEEIIKLSLRML
ncbi:MAG: Holliday junction branch migration protein RuvA [Firmicutes bacterium]|nr:Holliday junction branch migration protein RuvA [Bacillota bacterium]